MHICIHKYNTHRTELNGCCPRKVTRTALYALKITRTVVVALSISLAYTVSPLMSSGLQQPWAPARSPAKP